LQKEIKQIKSLLAEGKQAGSAKKQAATSKTVAKKSPARKKASTTTTSKTKPRSGAKS